MINNNNISIHVNRKMIAETEVQQQREARTNKQHLAPDSQILILEKQYNPKQR